MAHVAGYVVVNDVSARDWQGSPPALREGEKGDGQWLRAKGSDTFLPMGPDFVTADEVDPRPGCGSAPGASRPAASRQLMQDGTTADLIFGIPSWSASSRSRSRSSRATSSRPARRRRRRLPRPAGLPRAGRPRPLRDRGDRPVENPIVDWTEDRPTALDESPDPRGQRVALTRPTVLERGTSLSSQVEPRCQSRARKSRRAAGTRTAPGRDTAHLGRCAPS